MKCEETVASTLLIYSSGAPVNSIWGECGINGV